MKTTQKHWIALTASTLGLAGFSLASGFGDEKYTYDASGNVLEKQIGDQITRYTYTGNQLNGSESDSGSKQYAYDSSGRLTSDSEAGKSIRKMEHQYLDKVTKVQNGDKTTEFFYNAEGQLLATNSAGTSETFAWDDLAMVNRGEKLYVNEAHAVGGVPAIVGNEVAVSDLLGSSLSIGDGSFESTSFGEGLSDGLFTGKPFIPDLEGYLFHYRLYSAVSHRWLSADPSGFPDGYNNMSYAMSDPVNNFDPSGLATYVRTAPPGTCPSIDRDGPKDTTITNSGKIEYWAKATISTDTASGEAGFMAFSPSITGAVGTNTININCSLVGATPAVWTLSATDPKSGLGVSYTFGTSGTPSSSGGIDSPDLTDTSTNFWVGYGGMYQRKATATVWQQVFVRTSPGVFVAVDDPEPTSTTESKADSWLSENAGAKFVEYEN